MAGSAIVETVKTLYTVKDGGCKKVTLGCTSDSTAGTIDLYLSTGLINHLNGWELYQAITYPGITNPTADADFLLKERTAEVSFDAGSVEIVVDEWISDASGAKAQVAAIHVSNTDWAGGNGAGTIMLKKWNQTAFTNNDVLSGTSVVRHGSSTTAGAAVVAGASVVSGRDLTILDGSNALDAATPNIVIPTAQEAGEMYKPIIDDDFSYFLDVDNAGNSKHFVIDLYLKQ